MTWLFILFIILLFLILIKRISLSVNVHFFSSENVLRLSIYIYKIQLYKAKVFFTADEYENILAFLLNRQEETSPELNYLDELKQATKKMFAIFNGSRMTTLKWMTEIGVKDSAHTALFYGGVWIIKGAVLGMLDSRGVLKCKPKVNVTPRFNELYFASEVSCMISIRIGQAIYRIIRK